MAACVFCGHEGKLTKEHVFPEWVREHLRHPDGAGAHRRTELREGQEPTQREHRGEPATWTVKSVCAECNNGWMSAVEESAKPALLPLIRGKMRRLDVTAQENISAWSVKTALMAGSRWDPRLPIEFYREFFDAKCPVDPVRVWLGRTPHLEAHSMDWRPMRLHPEDKDPPSEYNGYQAVFSVGHLAVFLLRWREAKPQLERVFTRFDAAVVRVWPAERQVIWPSRATITLEPGLDELGDALAAVPIASASSGPPHSSSLRATRHGR